MLQHTIFLKDGAASPMDVLQRFHATATRLAPSLKEQMKIRGREQAHQFFCFHLKKRSSPPEGILKPAHQTHAAVLLLLPDASRVRAWRKQEGNAMDADH